MYWKKDSLFNNDTGKTGFPSAKAEKQSGYLSLKDTEKHRNFTNSFLHN